MSNLEHCETAKGEHLELQLLSQLRSEDGGEGMIIQIGTDVDESRILWKHKESDDWQGADIDDLIDVYEDILTGELISRAEVVEVVRCKDCKHSDTTGVYIEDVVFCNWIHTSCVKNGYCHRGERREDGDSDEID